MERTTLAETILQTVARFPEPGCLMEDLLLACPGFTWDQVYHEVDRLSGAGQVILTLEDWGKYRVGLPAPQGKAV
jgi:hypothetical protein